MKNPAILITEIDETIRLNLKSHLLPQGFDVIEVPDRSKALHSIQQNKPEVVLMGVSRDNNIDELKAVEQIRTYDNKVPIILLAENSSEAHVLAALKAKVHDYFKIPFSYQELVDSIKKKLFDPSCPSLPLTEALPSIEPGDDLMVGSSHPMQEVKGYLKKVAKTDSTVLITGETGTGKELTAEMIHRKSSRKDKPFISVNCTALPENLVESELFGYEKGAFTGAEGLKKGKFELASSGTIFLDEIGDMSLYTQAKILRVIEKKEVYRLGGKAAIPLDFRLIAATNKVPEELVKKGTFRNDLFYRLNIARIHLPSLRKRKEDIPHLIIHFIKEMNQRFSRNIEGIAKEAENFLLQYHFPGNIRELKNLIEASFINLPERRVTLMDLPAQMKKLLDHSSALPENERDQIVTTLLETKWNKSKAAKKLNWSRMTIYRKIEKYNIVEKRHPAR